MYEDHIDARTAVWRGSRGAGKAVICSSVMHILQVGGRSSGRESSGQPPSSTLLTTTWGSGSVFTGLGAG